VRYKKSEILAIELEKESPLKRSLKYKEECYQEDPDLKFKLALIRTQIRRYSEQVIKNQNRFIKPYIDFSQPEEFPLYKHENGKFIYYANTFIV
jgi:hypothetical protein